MHTKGHDARIWSIDFARDAPFMITGDRFGTALVWDLRRLLNEPIGDDASATQAQDDE